MLQRCYNPDNKDFKRYHGKGIVVCERLRTHVNQMIEVIGKRPEGLTLDRKDNRGNYSCGQCAECAQKGWPTNIRWTDRTIQSRNQDRIRLIEIDGKLACIGEWAKLTGIHYQTLMSRYLNGVRGEDLISSPGPTGNRHKCSQ